MAVFNNLNTGEASPVSEIHVVFTGKGHQLTAEQAEKCQAYFDHLNNQRAERGEKALKNGDTYPIVNEQRTPDGKVLFLTERSTYAHFLAFRDQESAKVKEIFGDTPIPPCPVGNPQTLVLAKPANEQGNISGIERIRNTLASKGPTVLLGVMGENTAFHGVVQAFGDGLNGGNMEGKKEGLDPVALVADLRERGFHVTEDDFSVGANRWDMDRITNQALQSQLGLPPSAQARPPIPLRPVRDNVGNYYFPSLTPVPLTAKQIIAGRPDDSKFREIIEVPANSTKGKLHMAAKGLNYRVYVPDALQRVHSMMQNRSLADLALGVAERIGQGRERFAQLKGQNPLAKLALHNPVASIIQNRTQNRSERDR